MKKIHTHDLRITSAVTGAFSFCVPKTTDIRSGFNWDDFQGLDAPYAVSTGSAYRIDDGFAKGGFINSAVNFPFDRRS